jgi:hypothetical protein
MSTAFLYYLATYDFSNRQNVNYCGLLQLTPKFLANSKNMTPLKEISNFSACIGSMKHRVLYFYLFLLKYMFEVIKKLFSCS